MKTSQEIIIIVGFQARFTQIYSNGKYLQCDAVIFKRVAAFEMEIPRKSNSRCFIWGKFSNLIILINMFKRKRIYDTKAPSREIPTKRAEIPELDINCITTWLKNDSFSLELSSNQPRLQITATTCKSCSLTKNSSWGRSKRYLIK